MTGNTACACNTSYYAIRMEAVARRPRAPADAIVEEQHHAGVRSDRDSWPARAGSFIRAQYSCM